MSDAAPAWRQTASMAFPRAYHNLTSLADGSVLVTSGSRTQSATDASKGVLQAELWSPDDRDLDDRSPRCRFRASTTRPRC